MKKIRLYPDSKQTATLNRWIGSSRWVYNTLVDAVNKGLKVDKKALRAKIVEKTLENKWLKEIPGEIKDFPVLDLIKAKKSSRNLKSFKFRSKKDPSQSIYISSRNWGRTRGKYFFLNEIKTTEKLPPIEHDTRLIKDYLNRFWICIPVSYSIEQKKIPRENQPRIISIDPGVRTFATCYDPKGSVYEWGKLDISKVFRLSLAIDKLISESTQVNSRKRKTCKRKIKRIRSRIRNLVDELHRKFSLWLCNNYDYVILPTFDSQGMVKRGNRKISSKTARKIMTMSHFRFRQHLLFKAKVIPTKVILVTEEFTSKTCGKCGTIKLNLGSSKVFSCSKCKTVLDRDVNGARNILIKTLTEVSF